MVEEAPLDVVGLIVVIVFYLIVLGVGIYASWRSRQIEGSKSMRVMLAGRQVGLFMGIMTMTASWVGGGYINGSAEQTYRDDAGVIWLQAQIGYGLSLTLGGLFFAKKFREANYVTFLDPFAIRYGAVVTGFLFIPGVLGEIFFIGAILSALGASLSVILGINMSLSIIVSAIVIIIYTELGGLYSVIITDIIQLLFLFFGLWLGVGFAFANDNVTSILEDTSWLGSAPEGPLMWRYIDHALLCLIGGFPFQIYFQRVLSVKTGTHARILSILGGLGAICMTVPAALMGAIAKSADWNATEYRHYGEVPIPQEDAGLVLPLVLRFLCPRAVTILGLGAVSAAVMSSADSSILAGACLFTRHIYEPIRNAVTAPVAASQTEILVVLRVAMFVVATIATIIAIYVRSIYGLLLMCTDLVYVLILPQIVCVTYIPFVNTYGALCGYFGGLFIRLAGGDSLLGIPTLIKFPMYDEELNENYFPFKTLASAFNFLLCLTVSLFFQFMYEKGWFTDKRDVFKCFSKSIEKDSKDVVALEKKKEEMGTVHHDQINPTFESGDK